MIRSLSMSKVSPWHAITRYLTLLYKRSTSHLFISSTWFLRQFYPLPMMISNFSSLDACPHLLASYKTNDWKPANSHSKPIKTSHPDTYRHQCGLHSHPASRQQNHPSWNIPSCNPPNSPPTSSVCHTFTRNPLMSCPLRAAGEIRPSVVIHYMPHRTFETPILCTCIPEVKIPEPPFPPKTILNRKRRSTGHITPLKKKFKSDSNIPFKSDNIIPFKPDNMIPFTRPVRKRSVYKVGSRPVRTYACSSKPAPRFSSLNYQIKKKNLKKVLLKPMKVLKIKLQRTRRSQRTVVKEPYCRIEPIDWDFHVVTVWAILVKNNNVNIFWCTFW